MHGFAEKIPFLTNLTWTGQSAACPVIYSIYFNPIFNLINSIILVYWWWNSLVQGRLTCK
jgi:hypothetical protein